MRAKRAPKNLLITEAGMIKDSSRTIRVKVIRDTAVQATIKEATDNNILTISSSKQIRATGMVLGSNSLITIIISNNLSTLSSKTTIFVNTRKEDNTFLSRPNNNSKIFKEYRAQIHQLSLFSQFNLRILN